MIHNKFLTGLIRAAFSSRISYAHGISTTPLTYSTVEQQLRQTCEKYPDVLAIASQHQNFQLTYSELYQKAKELAASFLTIGLKPQDRIGIYSPNNYEWVLVQFAAAMADLILVNINPAYQVTELEYALNKVQCKVLITASEFKSSNYINMLRELASEIDQIKGEEDLKSVKLPYLKKIIKIDDQKQDGFLNFKDLFSRVDSKTNNQLEQIVQRISPDNITNIQFTSGTTGKPKGAALTHMNIVNNGRYIAERLNYSQLDKVCISVPLYHCFGMVIGNLACISSGSAMIFPSEGFNAKAALQAVTNYKCTSLYGVPTMFIEYLNEYEKSKQSYDLSTLQKGVIAGSLAPQKLMKEIVDILNIKQITNGYGMTETSPISTQTKIDDSMHYKYSSVGCPLPHVEVKIIDEIGNVVPRGQPGEYCVRGYSVMKCYWGDEEATRKTIDKSGFLKSGDIAIMDENDYVSIVGRSKDMIIRGGENIYPKEIEDYLGLLPGVEMVQVVGCEDKKYGEEVAALIKMKHGHNPINRKEIFKHCFKKIAHFKIPKFVKFVQDYPYTITGKPQKFKMREMINQDLQDPITFERYKVR